MRKLMWFTIGFGLACGFCAYFTSLHVLPALVIALCGGLLIGRKFKRMKFLCFGCALGLCWFGCYQHSYLNNALTMDGKEFTGMVTISDYSYETDYGIAADGILDLDGQSYQIRVYINENTVLTPGDQVTGTFRLRYTAGGQEDATYHPGKGIFLLAYQKGEVTVTKGANDRFLPAVLAEIIKTRLRQLFPEDVFAFAKALLLGDGTGLSYETDTAFKISGIRHIIAVSGLHVMILYSLIHAVTFRNKWLTGVLCLPVLGIFAAMAGFTPSVVRACIMILLMVLAQICNREYDPPTSLAFAAFVMLIVNPMVITSVSFQLSVGCVAGIQLFSGRIREWLHQKMVIGKGRGLLNSLKRWIASSVSITLGAMSLTTPLSAYYFGTVSLIGILTNLLTLWVVNFIFNGLILACAVSWFSMEAALWLSGILIWPARFVLAVAKLLARFPLAAVYTRSPYIVAWLVFVYLLVGIYLSQFRKQAKVLVCCATLGLVAALFASWMEPLVDDLRVTVLDVGQGQSILLQSEGRTFLVDCGGDSDESTADIVAETLLSQGIARIDGIILTHGDADHAGALLHLLTRLKADRIYYPATESCMVENVQIHPVSEDMQIRFGSANITIFAPIYAEDPNENSLCVLFTRGDCDILITGDRGAVGELALLRAYTLPQVEVLLAGHHGSKYSTTEALLEAVHPMYLFISAGADNAYGHPAQEVLDRAREIGAQVYRTDLQGTLIFRR